MKKMSVLMAASTLDEGVKEKGFKRFGIKTTGATQGKDFGIGTAAGAAAMVNLPA